MFKIFTATVAATVMLATSASAQLWPNFDNGHFQVLGSREGVDPFCSMSTTVNMEGRSSIKVTLEYDGDQVALILTSFDWTPVKDQAYPGFSYYFSKSEKLFSGASVYGHENSIYRGFETYFQPAFLDQFATDEYLFVFRDPTPEETDDDLTTVAMIGLTGSGTAVSDLRRCMAFVERREAARIRREQANDFIDRNPFATPE